MTCPVMLAFNTRGNIVPVLCGSWSCTTCARQNAKLWAWRCRLHILARDNVAWFWTFTMRSKYHTAYEAYRDLPLLWDRLRKRLVRLGFSKWSYCAFVEGQPGRGYMPHFHVISMQSSPVRIKDLAMYSGFGYEAKETQINGPKAASYCAKYASKQNPNTPKGFRRVRASRDWAKLPPRQCDPLLVKSKAETTSDYLLRVAECTGKPLQDLVDAWLDTGQWLD